MPIYEYRCRDCGKSYEMLSGMQEADKDLECPECHSHAVERQLSSFSASGCGPTGRRNGFT